MKVWQNLVNASTEDLIRCYQDVGSTNRDEAFEILVLRFRVDLLKFCEARCRMFGQSSEVAEDICFETFAAYAKKTGFDSIKGKGNSIDDSFLIYLCGIAKNSLTNYYRTQKRKRAGKWSDGNERIVTEIPELPPTASIKAIITFQTIKSLPYSHQVIYFTYKSYERLGCNLPKKLQEEIRNHLGGIKQSTVRSYFKVANDKINIALQGLELSKKNTNGK